MNAKICDDRLDMLELAAEIADMTDEEFEEYLKTLK